MVAAKKRAVRQPKSGLTPADIAMIAEIAAQAVKAALAEEKQAVVKADPNYVPTEAEIASWSEEQVAEYNAAEAAKFAERKAKQSANLRKLDSMSVNERKQALTKERDKSVIRIAVPPDWDGNKDDLVRVVCKRHIGLGDGLSTDIDEIVDMYKPSAQAMQKSGVIEVAI